jgi:hypothetical protein
MIDGAVEARGDFLRHGQNSGLARAALLKLLGLFLERRLLLAVGKADAVFEVRNFLVQIFQRGFEAFHAGLPNLGKGTLGGRKGGVNPPAKRHFNFIGRAANAKNIVAIWPANVSLAAKGNISGMDDLQKDLFGLYTAAAEAAANWAVICSGAGRANGISPDFARSAAELLMAPWRAFDSANRLFQEGLADVLMYAGEAASAHLRGMVMVYLPETINFE